MSGEKVAIYEKFPSLVQNLSHLSVMQNNSHMVDLKPNDNCATYMFWCSPVVTADTIHAMQA